MEIIKIYQGNVVSARELHTFLHIKSKFADWIKNRINKYHFEEGTDYSKILEQLVRGQKQYDYLLTLSMAKELCMVENNEKGRQARLYFIQAEKTLRQLQGNKRLEAFAKLENTKEKLLRNVESVGGQYTDYVQIDLSGRKILFNGEPLTDATLPTLLIKARDFATELTNEGFRKGMEDLQDAETLNKANHDEVRQTIINSTKQAPESFKPEDDIKKLQNGDGEEE